MHLNSLKPSSILEAGRKSILTAAEQRDRYTVKQRYLFVHHIHLFFCKWAQCFVQETVEAYLSLGTTSHCFLLSYVRANWMNGILRIEFRCGDGSETRGSVFHAVWGNVERWRDKERRGLAFMKVHLDLISVHEGYSLCLFCLMSGIFSCNRLKYVGGFDISMPPFIWRLKLLAYRMCKALFTKSMMKLSIYKECFRQKLFILKTKVYLNIMFFIWKKKNSLPF